MAKKTRKTKQAMTQKETATSLTASEEESKQVAEEESEATVEKMSEEFIDDVEKELDEFRAAWGEDLKQESNLRVEYARRFQRDLEIIRDEISEFKEKAREEATADLTMTKQTQPTSNAQPSTPLQELAHKILPYVVTILFGFGAYWANQADNNSQRLEDRVINLEKEVSGVKADISNVKDGNKRVEGKLDTLQQMILNLKNDRG